MASNDHVTVSGVAKYGAILASAAVSLAVSAFGWGVAWASFQGRVDNLEARVVRLEGSGDRLMRMERMLATLVCASTPSSPDCREALGNIGRDR